MGYTHYYYVSQEFDAKQFAKVAADFKTMITPLKHLGVILADGLGQNHPKITPTEIWFNGLEKCGHKQRELGVTWPAEKASGVSQNKIDQQLAELAKGHWFAGVRLETRVCDGDCSHETFSLEQKLSEIPQWKKEHKPDRLIFECTKTAFKPYDLAVNVCLIIAKHHLGDAIKVTSDGDAENWQEGMQLCQHFLGYGEEFCLDKEPTVV